MGFSLVRASLLIRNLSRFIRRGQNRRHVHRVREPDDPESEGHGHAEYVEWDQEECKCDSASASVCEVKESIFKFLKILFLIRPPTYDKYIAL